MSTKCVLEMHEVSKSFPGVVALNKVSLKVYASKVNVLMGENGAGKSTLMKILSGALTKDDGFIKVDDKEVNISSPMDARNLGIAMIYQELNLAPNLTVAGNIFLGREPTEKGLVNEQKMNKDARILLNAIDIDINPKTIVGNLSMAHQQMVEIIKAISTEARIIVMDEPTSSLTENEVSQLFHIIEMLKQSGVAIIYISHRMDEIYQIGDYITVLRDGNKVGDWPISEINREDLIRQMVGRDISSIYPKEDIEAGRELLRVENLTRKGTFENISFSLKKGEILGFFGLVGAGRSEVVNAIFGRDLADEGKIWIDGKPEKIKDPMDAIRLGIGLVPEDRKGQGLNLGASVAHNISLAILERLTKMGLMKSRHEKKICNEMIDLLKIRTPNVQQLVCNLSGGNQQKVVIAKWIARDVKILILDEPTRGVDIGAKAEIHKLMSELIKKGIGIIMISSELPEFLGMSDRILVMHEGRITCELSGKDATQEKVMYYASGMNEVMEC